MRTRTFSGVAFMAMLVMGAPRQTLAQEGGAQAVMAPLEEYLMADRNAEIALARSAAPSAISDAATILVLGRRGYEPAVTGKNGFVCVVDRAWQGPFNNPDFWNAKVRAPVCLNPQAVRSVVPVTLKRTEWALAGLSKAEMMAQLNLAIDKGELPRPELGAMSYMMGKDKSEPPHLMFYLPNAVRAADWGANLPNSPVLGGYEASEPAHILIVPVMHWSDGTAAPVHK